VKRSISTGAKRRAASANVGPPRPHLTGLLQGLWGGRVLRQGLTPERARRDAARRAARKPGFAAKRGKAPGCWRVYLLGKTVTVLSIPICR